MPESSSVERTSERSLIESFRSARIERHLLGPDGLTERASTFDRRDVPRALASAYPNGETVALPVAAETGSRTGPMPLCETRVITAPIVQRQEVR